MRTVTHGMNDSLTASWTHIKHTGKYTDLVTNTPCTHSLNQRLMFCQGLSLYPPSAKNKWSEDVVEKITFEEFTSSAFDEKKERYKVLIQGPTLFHLSSIFIPESNENHS